MTSIEKAHYHRYHIQTADAPDIVPWPPRFNVRVGKIGLAKLILRELIHTRGDMEVTLSRPCLYGVFSGPIGGFAPRPQFCVGCLRCTTQHPDFVTVTPNPERRKLGDSYFIQHYVDAVAQEAQTGRVPVKGAGYRGAFGGEGFDGMWTDMSEIVRPTRDGIHGREFISTVIDIGEKPNFLTFDAGGQPVGETPRVFSIQVPFAYDMLPDAVARPDVFRAFVQTAAEVDTLAVVPLDVVLKHDLQGDAVVPLVTPAEAGRLGELGFTPRMVEMDGWDADLFATIRAAWPQAVAALRTPFVDGEALRGYFEAGVRVFHLTADYHGRTPDGAYILDAIRAAHMTFVEMGDRERVTLLGSGGIIAAEHIPKAIIAGLDGVFLDTALLVALQARFDGEFTDRRAGNVRLPKRMPGEWAVQRLRNLSAAWHDQLLEILGAMGLREVRRLRGEMGRAMFQVDLEREAFAGIEGYPVEEVAR